MKTDKTNLYVDNYGELLAQVNDMELVYFETDHGYQGEYCVVLTDGERLFYYVGHYGSCSGCDWLEDVGSWGIVPYESEKLKGEKKYAYSVGYKEALDYCGGIKPKYIVHKDSPMEIINKGEYNGFGIKVKKDYEKRTS